MVTDALNQVTQYTYDLARNKLTQQDANTHTTGYAWDNLNRRTSRTLPLGQTESFTYDPVGNMQTRTDFNGKTTTFAYDSLNRVLSRTPDPSFSAAPITFTYTATGQRLTMTDPSGTTTYTYTVSVWPTQGWVSSEQRTSEPESGSTPGSACTDSIPATLRRGNPSPARLTGGRIPQPKEWPQLSDPPARCPRAASSFFPAPPAASSSPPGCWITPLKHRRSFVHIFNVWKPGKPGDSPRVSEQRG